MNTKQIKAVLLGTLLAIVPLADSIAHTSTPTPTIEERLAEKCADKQVKALTKYQGCIVVALIRASAKPTTFDVNAAKEKCATKVVDSLLAIQEKYSGFCAVSGGDMVDAGLPAYLSNQATCFAQYFLEGNAACYP